MGMNSNIGRDQIFTPKKRMLNAYRGIFSDHYPVAPEFWYYYPAKVMGIDMIEFEREIPHWKAMQETFSTYNCEGWGIVAPVVNNPERKVASSFKKISNSEYRGETIETYKSGRFRSSRIYMKEEPSWTENHPVEKPEELPLYLEMVLSEKNEFDFSKACEAHKAVGEDYLLELSIGLPFFDFIATAMGFEQTIYYFLSEDESVLRDYQQRYTAYCKRMISEASEKTRFESFFIGCSYSNASLLGPDLWRQWEKPFHRAMSDEAHRHDLLVHSHIHGDCRKNILDFHETELDCICPFERPPGGDIEGKAGLEYVRDSIGDAITMNGNVHTVETLIRGTPDDVRREVQEIKEVFQGLPRLIIGTGDQVGKETPEENIYAMIEEGVK